MDILRELKRAWENAFPSERQKEAAKKDNIDKLKREIEDGSADEIKKEELPAPSYEKLERKPIDDAEIEKKARAGFTDYERQRTKNVEDGIAAERQKAEKDLLSAAEREEKSNRAVDEAYDRAKRDFESDVIKRGIARSSVAASKSAELIKGRAEALAEARRAYLSAAEEIEKLLSSLDEKKTVALGELKAEIEAKTSAAAAALREKAEQADRDAIKYNNEIEAKKAADERAAMKAEQDAYSEALSNAEKEKELYGARRREARYLRNYAKMDEAFSEMSMGEAARILKEDPFFRANLSDALYLKLYEKYAK